ncbi:hypothetical protein [Nocardioides sp.]|uniref:hypothetical protein n=1 Tax=Nocardioides sp. TaxID=35761 RepID=UPI00262A4910|nr:hypothetical protein [Nocardioides sp.]
MSRLLLTGWVVPPAPGNVGDWIDLALAIAAVGALIAGWARWVRPRLAAKRDRDESVQTVLLGRPAVPANAITGADPQPAIPSIGSQVATLSDIVAQLARTVSEVAGKVEGIHHEIHPNGGSSLNDSVRRTEAAAEALRDDIAVVKTRQTRDFGVLDQHAARLARIEELLAGELTEASATIANAAEASATVLRVIDTALNAAPPTEPA